MSEQDAAPKTKHTWRCRARRLKPWMPYILAAFPLISAYEALRTPTVLIEPEDITVEGMPEGTRVEGVKLALTDPTTWERFVAASPWVILAVAIVAFLTGLRILEKRAKQADGHPFPKASMGTAGGAALVLMAGILGAMFMLAYGRNAVGTSTTTNFESTFASLLLLAPLYLFTTMIAVMHRGSKEYEELEKIV